MREKKAYEVIVEQPPIKMPHNVMRFFPDGARQIDFAGNQASFGEDYGDIEELRSALEWLVDQFNGNIVWDSE